MTVAKPTHCLRCGVGPMFPNRTPVPEGMRPSNRHHSRGLCWSCWQKAKAEGALEKYPRLTQRNDDLIEDYRDIGGPRMSTKDAARRLGVSFACLDQALCRYRRKEKEKR